LPDGVPVGPRWRKLAHRKISEVEQSIKRYRRLRSLLQHLLHCRCTSLKICVQRLSLNPDLRFTGKARPEQRYRETRIRRRRASGMWPTA
jgi:hypothetical protein